MKIVLASESVFRRRALDMLALDYEVCPSRIDEKAIRADDAAQLTRKLAEAKAWKVADQWSDAIVVSGDAVVSKDGKIFEKPRDKQEAIEFLKDFSGSEFQFVTALTVINTQSRHKLSAVETSNIAFRQLDETEIRDYVKTYDVERYAGGFESDAVLRFAERICGSYNFVTALPVSRLIVFLRAQGIRI
jgi:septum formation protein